MWSQRGTKTPDTKVQQRSIDFIVKGCSSATNGKSTFFAVVRTSQAGKMPKCIQQLSVFRCGHSVFLMLRLAVADLKIKSAGIFQITDFSIATADA